MNSITTHPLGIVVLLTIGLLIFMPILKALKQTALFKGHTPIVVAICVTILSLLGIHDFLGNPAVPSAGRLAPAADVSDHNRIFHISLLLIPYAALGLSILAMLLLMGFGKLSRGPKRNRSDEDRHNPKPQDQDWATGDHDRRCRDRSRFES